MAGFFAPIKLIGITEQHHEAAELGGGFLGGDDVFDLQRLLLVGLPKGLVFAKLLQLPHELVSIWHNGTSYIRVMCLL